MYSRQATVAYDSQNISVLGVLSITEPTSYPVPVAVFQLWCDIVLAPVPTVLNMTANETTFDDGGTNLDVEYSLSYLLRLFNSDYGSYLDGGLSLLRGFLAVPFQFSTALQQMGDINHFPEENHVTASLSKSSYRAIVEVWTVCVFVFLAFLLTSWGIICLTWISFYGPNSPNTSFFPEIDITSKSSVNTIRQPYYSNYGQQMIEIADETLADLGKFNRSYGLGNGKSTAVIRAIRGKRVFCGSCPGSRDGENIIVLVMESGQVKILNQREKYA
jgi:hypothetical protein